MLEKLRSIDQAIFLWFQDHFRTEGLDHLSILLANVYFWTPVLIFLVFLLYMQNPQKGITHFFFALASLVLSYQAAFLLSYFIGLPAPYVVEHFNGGPQLPAFQETFLLSFPDWSIAAFWGGSMFIIRRIRTNKRLVISISILTFLIIAFFRIYAGYAFFSDILFGTLVGIVFGWIFSRFLIHFDYIAASRGSV